MEVDAPAGNGVFLFLLERRAKGIRDPVKRLRFLRRSIARRGGPWTGQDLDWGRRKPARPAIDRRGRLAPRPLAGILLLLLAVAGPTGSDVNRLPHTPDPGTGRAEVPRVWLVERTAEFELYSNGLRVERGAVTSNRRRLPCLLPREWDEKTPCERRTAPAGIVFHTSESLVAPFEPEQNPVLKRLGHSLLAYVSGHRLYHFVVDRFGRVHRILEETDRADHAGQSVWADGERVYLDLSESFLGVAFEGQSAGNGQGVRGRWPVLSPAQLHAGRVLTEMLRSKHQIPAGNCVTHAQVSVNAGNYRIGYHTDWAEGFPFRELGLADNYDQPPASLSLFGFRADSLFVQTAGSRLRRAVEAAQEQVRREAATRGLSPGRYRALLAERYRRAAIKVRAAEEEP